MQTTRKLLSGLGLPQEVRGNQSTYSQKGFTMIELLITVMLLVVLGAVAAPNFGNAVSNNRLVSQTNDLVTAISLARQMAVSRGQVVFVCHTNNASSGTPTCGGGTASGWQSGFLVYAAPFNAQLTANRDYNSGTDTMLKKVHLGGNERGIYVTPTNATSHLGFRGLGLLFGAPGDVSMLVCDNRSGDYGKRLHVGLAGRIFIESGQTCA